MKHRLPAHPEALIRVKQRWRMSEIEVVRNMYNGVYRGMHTVRSPTKQNNRGSRISIKKNRKKEGVELGSRTRNYLSYTHNKITTKKSVNSICL